MHLDHLERREYDNTNLFFIFRKQYPTFIRIWMILFGQLIVSLLYLLLVSCFIHTKHFVVVRVELLAAGEVSREINSDGSAATEVFGGFRDKIMKGK